MDSRKEFDRKLISLIRDNPILYEYDLRLTTKKQRLTRERIWQQIATEMNCDLSECKTRWKTVRDSYIKMHRLKDKDKGPLNSKYYGSDMRFLEILLREKELQRNAKLVPQSSTNGKDSIKCEEKVVDVTDEYPELRKCKVDLGKNVDNLFHAYLATPGEINHNEEHKNKKLKVSEEQRDLPNGHDELLQIAPKNPVKVSLTTVPKSPRKNSMQIVSKSPEKVDTFETENPVFTFFKSMAQTVAQFPPEYIAETRIKVCQCVGEMEVRALMEKIDSVSSTQNF